MSIQDKLAVACAAIAMYSVVGLPALVVTHAPAGACTADAMVGCAAIAAVGKYLGRRRQH